MPAWVMYVKFTGACRSEHAPNAHGKVDPHRLARKNKALHMELPRVYAIASFRVPLSNSHAHTHTHTLEWVKARHPKWNLGKWKHGLKPASTDGFMLTHTHILSRTLCVKGPQEGLPISTAGKRRSDRPFRMAEVPARRRWWAGA